MKAKTKKFATMTTTGAVVVTASSKKEAAEKLGVKANQVYRYDGFAWVKK